MNSKKIIIISSIFFALSFFILLFFHAGTKSSPWKKWHVIAVEKSVPEKDVLNYLSKIKVEDVVSISSPRSNFAPEITPILPNSLFGNYTKNQDKYFSDRSGNFRLYYVPKRISSSKLKAAPFKAVQDLNTTNYIFLFAFILFFYVFCAFFYSNSRLKFSLSTFPFLIYVLFNPSLQSLFASIFFLTAVLLWSRTENRRYRFEVTIKNPYILSMLCASLICAVLSLWKSFMLYLDTLVLCATIYVLYEQVSFIFIKQGEYFNYTKIVGSYWIPKVTSRTIYCFYTICALIIVSGILTFTIPLAKNKKTASYEIPCPSRTLSKGFSYSAYSKARKNSSEEKQLPDLSNYVDQVWNGINISYNTLNEKSYISPVKRKSTIQNLEYYENDGKIESKINIIEKFSSSFIKKTIKKIKKQDEPTIEKILVNQGGIYRVKYSGAKNDLSIKIIVMLMGLFFSCSDILLFFVLKKKNRKN
ncbi:MAG: hypothetical protein K6G52_09210 [Treponemataceae bacterium]|nr:hypothetical protein [Treponemataceae bacterium]